MHSRIIELPSDHSFFLFGARGTGKSTLLHHLFHEQATWIDLLDPAVEDTFSREPGILKSILENEAKQTKRIIIDEIQKLPRLLDLVHWGIEKYPDIQFILTGSSARKLRYGAANLLAGRAFYYHLYPFSYLELEEDFNIDEALSWGLLPAVTNLTSLKHKADFLETYTLMYLKEEIWAEHLIRKLDPFRKFLEVSAQMNGKIVNYDKIAHDVNVDPKTVKEYFLLLEDTLVGFMLEPFHGSVRKRLSKSPKFYYFDMGVTRALSRTLSIPLQKSTFHYGDMFEHFIILECWKLIHYFHHDWRMSYLRTKDDAEIDLIIERPGKPLLCIQIKSSTHVEKSDLTSLISLSKDLGNCEVVCFSNDIYPKKVEQVHVFPWKQGVKRYFSGTSDVI